MPQNFEPSRENAAGRERTFAERKATMAGELVILARRASEWFWNHLLALRAGICVGGKDCWSPFAPRKCGESERTFAERKATMVGDLSIPARRASE